MTNHALQGGDDPQYHPFVPFQCSELLSCPEFINFSFCVQI
jgi:hypothetical protein